MAFSKQEQEIIQYGIKNGKSKEEVVQALANFRAGITVPQPDTSTQDTQTEPSFLDRAGESVTRRGDTASRAIAGEGEFAGQGDISRGFQASAEVATAPLEVGFQALPKPVREGLKVAGDVVAAPFKFLSDKLASTKLFSEIGNLEAQGYINKDTAPELYNVKEGLQIGASSGEIAGDILAFTPLSSSRAPASVTKHFKDAETTLKNIPASDLQELGGISQFLSTQKQNLVLGLQAEGQKALASTINKLDISKFSSLPQFEKAVTSAITAPPVEAVVGAGTRAVADATGSALRKAVGSVGEIKPPSFKAFHIAVNPQTRAQAVDALKGAYKDSFIENRTAINNKLDKIANRSSFGDKKITKDNLVTNLADEGYLPEIDGRLADFSKTFADLQGRKSRVMEAIEPQLENVKELTPLETLKSQVAKDLIDNPQVLANLDSSLSELERFFKSFETKYGTEVTAKQVNEIRKAMNSRTRSFGEEAFKQDTADAIADSMRTRLDELVPTGDVRTVNAEWARLNRLEKTAQVFHNQQVDVGILGRALGSYAGTIAASGVGLSVGGPGGLIIAGLAAHYGGDAMANALRRLRFNPELQKMIVQEVRQDDALVKRLIEEANAQNKKTLEQLLLPAPGGTSVIELPPAQLGTGPGSKTTNPK